LMGLLSPGGVHSHERHLFAMLELAVRMQVPEVAVHAFLDVRDMPPKSAGPSLAALHQRCDALAGGSDTRIRIASVSGRYYAMDRDERWDRVRRAWEAIVEARAGYGAGDDAAATDAAYARGENDEFVAPTVVVPSQGEPAPMAEGDAVVFMNF